MTEIYTRIADSYAEPWYSYTYRIGPCIIKCREWALSLEAGRERLGKRLKRMSREYQGKLPPGRYARNATISMNNNRARRKGKR